MGNNNKLQKAELQPISSIAKNEAITKVKSILTLANLAGSGANKMEDTALAILAIHVAKDYEYATLQQIESAILNGIKGKYNGDEYVPITSITIYGWLKKGVPKESLTKDEFNRLMHGE